MKKYNPRNERIKQDYYGYLKHAKRRSVKTVDGIRKAIQRYEEYTQMKDFSTFNKEQAMGFVRHLTVATNASGQTTLGNTTKLFTLSVLRDFYVWLAMQEGFRRKIRLTDIDYLNISEKEERAAKAPKVKKYPSLEQVRLALSAMPVATEIDRRNRALFALAILTGIRVNALISLRLKHIYMSQDPVLIEQRPDEVATKFSKGIYSFLLPIGDDFHTAFLDWVKELKDQNYGDDDPVFPKTRIGHNENLGFYAEGLERAFWANSTPVRDIFKSAFTEAGLPYFNPHSFRHTLAHLMSSYCRNFEDLKAWSQNLGHEHIQTTAMNYHKLNITEQGEILKRLKTKSTDASLKKSDLKIRLMELAESLE
jgi:integrase/recombinase XerD